MPPATKYSEEKQRSHQKMNVNYFDYADYEEKKTRNSTFSKASESRDDIQKHAVSFYEKAFVHEQNTIGFYNPVDEEDNNADGILSLIHI